MSTTIGFNYDTLEGEQRTATRSHAKAFQALLDRTGTAAVEIGRRLNAVHAQIGAGKFQAWLQGEFQWSQPLASKYMRIARFFGDLNCLDKFQPHALYQLAKNKTDPRAVAEAIERARAGENITNKLALELVAKFLPAVPTNPVPRPTPRPSPRIEADAEHAIPELRDLIRQVSERLSQPDQNALADELFALAASMKAAAAVARPAVADEPAPKRATADAKRAKVA